MTSGERGRDLKALMLIRVCAYVFMNSLTHKHGKKDMLLKCPSSLYWTTYQCVIKSFFFGNSNFNQKRPAVNTDFYIL